MSVSEHRGGVSGAWNPEDEGQRASHVTGGCVRLARSAQVAAVAPTCKVVAWFDAEGALELFQTCPPARLGRWEPT